MAVLEFLPQADPELRQQLRELPEFDPPAQLWERIAAATPAKRPQYWPYGIAAALLVAATLGWAWRQHEGAMPVTAAPAPVPADVVAADGVAAVATVDAAGASQASLRRRLDAIDRSLQQALDTQAPATQIADLVGERQRVSDALVRAGRPDATILTL